VEEPSASSLYPSATSASAVPRAEPEPRADADHPRCSLWHLRASRARRRFSETSGRPPPSRSSTLAS